MLSLQQRDGFYFQLFLSATQGLPRMWPFCMSWLLLLPGAFPGRLAAEMLPLGKGKWNQRAKHLGTGVPSAHPSPSSLQPQLSLRTWTWTRSWAPTGARPRRSRNEAPGTQRWENSPCPQSTALWTLGKCSSPWFTWQNMRKRSQMTSWESSVFS